MYKSYKDIFPGKRLRGRQTKTLEDQIRELTGFPLLKLKQIVLGSNKKAKLRRQGVRKNHFGIMQLTEASQRKRFL